MEKMTKREKFEAVIAIATEAGREDLVEFAQAEIAALAAKAEKAKARRAEKAAEADPIYDAVEAVLGAEPMTIPAIVEAIAIEDATPNKVTARLTKLVKAGVAVKSEVKIPATEGAKARKVSAYARA